MRFFHIPTHPSFFSSLHDELFIRAFIFITPILIFALLYIYIIFKRNLFTHLHFVHKINITLACALIMQFFLLSSALIAESLFNSRYDLEDILILAHLILIPFFYSILMYDDSRRAWQRLIFCTADFFLLNLFFHLWVGLVNAFVYIGYLDFSPFLPVFIIGSSIFFSFIMILFLYVLLGIRLVAHKLKQTYFIDT